MSSYVNTYVYAASLVALMAGVIGGRAIEEKHTPSKGPDISYRLDLGVVNERWSREENGTPSLVRNYNFRTGIVDIWTLGTQNASLPFNQISSSDLDAARNAGCALAREAQSTNSSPDEIGTWPARVGAAEFLKQNCQP